MKSRFRGMDAALLAVGLCAITSVCAGATGVPDLGANASLHGKQVFPADNPWNQAVDREPVDPKSDVFIDSIGRDAPFHPDFGADYDGGPFGIPYVVVSGDTPGVAVTFKYDDQSDPGPYPIPPDPPIEGGASSTGDRHILILDRDHWKLYELYAAYPNDDGSYRAGSGAIYDLNSNAVRPADWTSADAAGLPIFPGLVRYDEVIEQKAIRHAIRFTVENTRRAYVYPARHFASESDDPSLPPMGMRVRLKAGYDVSGFPDSAKVILQALKTYGMILADNGSNWYASGVPDARWSDDDLSTLKSLTGNDFEVVDMRAVSAADVTLLFRFLLGLQSPSADDLAYWDVMPIPGKNGKAQGDSLIGADDLNWAFRRFISVVGGQ